MSTKIAPVDFDEFSRILEANFAAVLKNVNAIAVGVSGGPDSMALAALLGAWALGQGIPVHALTVDHGLRADSGLEAKEVGRALNSFPGLKHSILKWCGRKPVSRIMEAAREARYALMAEYCLKNKIEHLFLAHHQDDQAETFMFRLAKGSGLDGLAGMQKIQRYSPPPQPSPRRGEGVAKRRVGGQLILLRPFLGVPKNRLIATCTDRKIKFIKDPSNMSNRFARPRLRESRAVLEQEGLSAKRLAVTAARLDRARATLDHIAAEEFTKACLEANTRRVVLKSAVFDKYKEEIALRILVQSIRRLRTDGGYLPRMESIEDILADLLEEAPFRKRTLGGLTFERNQKKAQVLISLEL